MFLKIFNFKILISSKNPNDKIQIPNKFQTSNDQITKAYNLKIFNFKILISNKNPNDKIQISNKFQTSNDQITKAYNLKLDL